jgi:hypothetical protein
MPTADRPGAWQLVRPVFRHERARPFRAAAPRWLSVAGLRPPSRDEWLALTQLDARLLRTVFAQIATTTNSKGQEQSPSAMQHLRTTLRSGGDRAGLADLRRGPALRPIAGHRHPRCDLTPGCATGGLQGPPAVDSSRHRLTRPGLQASTFPYR